MQKVFERFVGDEKGNAVIDWTVLIAGLFLMALSVILTLTGNTDNVTAEHMVPVAGAEASLQG